MKSLYRSVIFAALVVESSLTLLTGAQAQGEIDFGPSISGNFTFTNSSPGIVQGVSGPTNGLATFDGLTGTFSFGGSGGTGAILFSGFNGTNFNTVTTALGNPTGIQFSADFGAGNSLAGVLTLTQLHDANPTDIIGTFLVNTANGLLASADPVGSRQPFNWPLNPNGSTDGMTPSACLAACTPLTFSGGAGTVAVPGPIVGAGLPGLITALGGLVAMARRRRKQLA